MAANFTETLKRLVSGYRQQQPDFRASISSGSSGKHYAQIRQGAPFDLFFSADDQRPADLVASGHGQEESLFTYALGVLMLWSLDPQRLPEDGLEVLRAGDFRRLAIANPRVAPYGTAAMALLEREEISLSRGQLVTGQSLGQAFNFVVSGNAELGLVAASQVIAYERQHPAGSRWTPTAEHYPEVRQQVVLLKNARHPELATVFLHWIRHDEQAHQILQEDGYALPAP
ncbi:MAG: molybdate ABC transporter substrate-binding protein [Halomonadaceae bacterium]|nr:MAG: molybdate ABC transporter substrate-binding protein [Halomonadaceae bacterium]